MTTLNRRQFFSLDLRRLLDGLRHMTLALDSSDFGHVRVPINQSLVVFQLGPLTSTLDSTAVGGIGTPESDVAIVRSREDVLVVGGELGGEDTIKRLDSWICKKVEERTRKERTYRCILCVWYMSREWPFALFHKRTVRSYDAVTRSSPVGLNSTSMTAATWSLSTFKARSIFRMSKM